MNNMFEYQISYDSMRKILENYYANEGKEVSIIIHDKKDDDTGMVNTIIEIKEKIMIAGVELPKSEKFNLDEVKKIMKEVLAKEDKILIELINNANVQTKTVGFWMGEHDEEYIADRSFTVFAKEKEKVYKK